MMNCTNLRYDSIQDQCNTTRLSALLHVCFAVSTWREAVPKNCLHTAVSYTNALIYASMHNITMRQADSYTDASNYSNEYMINKLLTTGKSCTTTE